MKLFLLPLLFCVATCATAQDCKNFLLMQNGKTIEMTIYNKKGEENGKKVYTVSNYQGSGKEATATIHSELFDKKGKSIGTGQSNIKCNGGSMMMDLKMSLPGETAKDVDASAQSFYIDYPVKMNVGDALSDGHMQIDIDSKSGLKESITLDVTNRKVEAKESVTTTAGTWDCFKITSHTKMIIKVVVGIPVNVDQTEWYAPGVGIIKTESKSGGTAVTSIR